MIDIKQIAARFKPGDYVDASGRGDFFSIGKIIDIFHSVHTDNIMVGILFFRNVMRQGPAGGDMILITPDRTLRFKLWKKITLHEANQHRMTVMEQVMAEVDNL